MLNAKSIFANIIAYIAKNNVDVADVAKELDMNTASFWALGDLPNGPTWENIGKITDILGVNLAQLMQNDDSSVFEDSTPLCKEYKEEMPTLTGTEALSENVIDKIYGSVLGKVIGNHLGIPLENWDSADVLKEYPHIKGYVTQLNGKVMHPDDDLNGFFTFARMLEQVQSLDELNSDTLREVILNNVPYHHGFYWWSNYGAETLAFNNSIKGLDNANPNCHDKYMDEGVCGQIFYESLGIVTVGDYVKAADVTQRVVPTNSLGESLYGAMFINACVSAAFVKNSIEEVIDCGLSVIPTSSQYYKSITAVKRFYEANPHDWMACLNYIEENYCEGKGWDFNTHVVMALLYGNKNFSRTLEICVQSGSDTDCTASNVGAILGAMLGAEAITSWKWITPLNDMVICSTVLGSENQVCISEFACKLAYYAAKFSGKTLGESYYPHNNDYLHKFNLGDATFGAKAIVETNGVSADDEDHSYGIAVVKDEVSTTETGDYALKFWKWNVEVGQEFKIAFPTYYPNDVLYSNKYEPCNAPMVYPGQTVSVRVTTTEDLCRTSVKLVAVDCNNQTLGESEEQFLRENNWIELELQIPASNRIVRAIQVVAVPDRDSHVNEDGFDGLAFYMDGIKVTGTPHYLINDMTLANYNSGLTIQSHNSYVGEYYLVDQFSDFTGSLKVNTGTIELNSNTMYGFNTQSGLGMCFLGTPRLKDYRITVKIVPVKGLYHLITFGVKGSKSMYAFGLYGTRKVALLKSQEVPGEFMALRDSSDYYDWDYDNSYDLTVKLFENTLQLIINGETVFKKKVNDMTPFSGAFGVVNLGEATTLIQSVEVTPVKDAIDYTNYADKFRLESSTSNPLDSFLSGLESEDGGDSEDDSEFIDFYGEDNNE